MGCIHQLTAQANFLLNGGFEDINTCSEYNAQCGVEGWFYLKDVKAHMMTNRTNTEELGNNSFAIFYNWLGYEDFTPVIGTVLPCGLQKGKKYVFSGLFSAQLNPKLLLHPGIALGSKFYVPKKSFSGNIHPDSIINIKALATSDLYEFAFLKRNGILVNYLLSFIKYGQHDTTYSKTILGLLGFSSFTGRNYSIGLGG